MRQNKRFAITGGIGSGKSTLLAIFRELGYPAFSCDEISHVLWGEEGYRRSLALLFPDCLKEGEIDREALTRLVFSNEAERKRLEAFAHPRIMERLFACTNSVPVSFSEVPLLFEGGHEGEFNGVIVVVREDAARLRSAALRDGRSEEDILLRMQAQTEKHGGHANILTVENNGGKGELRAKAEEVLRTWNI